MWENIVTIHNILKKKITKQNRQKTILGKKKFIKKAMQGNIVVIHKFFFKKLMKKKNKNLNELS